MGERKGTIEEADWAADSARSNELAASGPPERVRAALDGGTLVSRQGLVPAPEPPPTVQVRRPDRDAPTTVGRDAPPDAPPSPSDRHARSFGKYRFIATLGHGGMADVHLAVAVGPAGFSKLQVIKRLRPNIADEPEFRDMLLDEARLAARLNHRNVVQTNEVGLADGEYFIAMEYLDGQPLSRVISRAREQARTIPFAVQFWILSEVLAGLHYAHELVDYDGTPLNVVHRDISPHNIFVTYDGQVKIVDFGIALAAHRLVETQTGTMKGKVAYMAPEQAFSHSSQIDRRADVFSAGVILWEMLAGRRLWRGLSDPQIISRLMRDIPDLRSARPEVPVELARICAKALAHSPGERYSTAAAFRAELDRYAERLEGQVTAEQLGALMRELFASERSEIRAIIDRQLKQLQEHGADAGSAGLTGRAPRLPSLPGRDPLDSDPPAQEEGATTGSSPSAPTRPLHRSSAPQATLHAVVRTEPATAVQPAPTPRRSRLPLVAFAAVIALVGAATLYLKLRDPVQQSLHATAPPVQSAPPAPEPSPPRAEASPPSAASSAPREETDASLLRASIKASPASAKIFVDGVELPSNPFDGKLIKDGAAHRIEVSAPGHAAQRRMLVFDRDIELEVTLSHAQRGPAPATTATSKVVKPPVEVDPTVPPPKPDPY
ncbi:serine/threonine protein kinase [Sorangium atrum]|uniref:non-specific serine/threonine protein kinase n=1 Tax=Sorangium atrum TaxID=2995308 RepID=A0ABT5BZ60_9BACT|nr:serine/threonine-protein kinase [Sorangium aterium]MDC0679440.1 serine/threonine-protein kinase [Sorangium aterium]